MDVNTPHGDGEAIFLIDYGININSIWVVRFDGGLTRNYYSDDIRVYGNPMNGKGWDVERLDGKVSKLPAGARRSTKFLKK